MTSDERFLVSGWEDDLNDIDASRNPQEETKKKILLAAENGHLDDVKALISNDPNLVNATDDDGYTPLHRACYGNHLAVVMYLIQQGANIRAETEVKWQPLHSCCQWNHVQCAAFLIHHGADVNAQSEGGQTPLHIAASHGTSYDSVQLLLMHPFIQPNIKNNNGETASDIGRRSSKYYNIFDMADPLLESKLLETLKGN